MQYHFSVEIEPERPHRVGENDSEREIPWFAPSIKVDLRGETLPNQVIRLRNRALLALGIQFAATVAGFTFCLIRRVKFQGLFSI